jgi:hypothetical protein
MLTVSRQPLVETWLAAADPAAWRRRPPGGDEAPLSAGWWAEFVAATRGRWKAAPTGTAGSADARAAAETWTLVQPGGGHVTLAWVAGGVVVCDVQAARCEQARLEEAAQEALRQGLRR